MCVRACRVDLKLDVIEVVCVCGWMGRVDEGCCTLVCAQSALAKFDEI